MSQSPDTTRHAGPTGCENPAPAHEDETPVEGAADRPVSTGVGITGGIKDGEPSASAPVSQGDEGSKTGDDVSPLTPSSGSGWVPDFPGQRAPFQPGNTVAVQHGAHSPRKVDPIAQELVDSALADPSLGYLRTDSYRPALWAWARAEAQAQILDEYLADRPVGSVASKRSTAAYRELHRAETRAANLRTQLGLTPLSRARLGKDVAQGRQADAAAELTRMREEAERADRERGGDTDA